MSVNSSILKNLLLILVLGTAAAPGYCAGENAEKELLNRIDRSKVLLEASQKAVSLEMSEYGERFNRIQKKNEELRKTAAAAQRIADEQLLGLDKLEARVEEWTRQNNYQQHLLNSYAQLLETDESEPRAETGLNLHVLESAVARVESSLRPHWTDEEILTVNGALAKYKVLELGPVAVAYKPETGEGGTVFTNEFNESQFEVLRSDSAVSQLKSLLTGGVGEVTFDPTLGNARQLAGYDESLSKHLAKGGVWALPILFFGFLSFVISMLKAVEILRLPKVDTGFLAEFKSLKNRGEDVRIQLTQLCGKLRGPQLRLFEIASATPVSARRDDLLVAYLSSYKHRIERFMGIVTISAAVSPLLGLLGTVSGMISTFKMMTIFGTGDAATVSGGISEALITTELGLIVAIPSLIASALLYRKIKSYHHKLEVFAINLSKLRVANND